MASRSRYVKLALPTTDKITGKNNVVGCVVIADYHSADGQRTIVVERPLTAAGHRATKPKVKSPKVNAKPEPVTPIVGAVNG